jgi:hypothetical protein
VVIAPPKDPSTLGPIGVAMVVAALGGGAVAAWMFRSFLSIVPAMSDDPGWLELVMFAGTSGLTMRAVHASLESHQIERWLTTCLLYGALNGVVCSLAYLPFTLFERDLGALCCATPFAAVVGACLGLAFCVGYLPVLALAARARREPSLDLVARMIPWCAAWLTAIAIVVGLAGEPQRLLAAACLAVSALVIAGCLAIDRRRAKFLASLALPGAPDHRFSREGSSAVLPFVGGAGTSERALVADARSEHGPFRSAATTQSLAGFSADPAREGRVLRRRAALVLAVLAADGLVATAIALA